MTYFELRESIQRRGMGSEWQSICCRMQRYNSLMGTFWNKTRPLSHVSPEDCYADIVVCFAMFLAESNNPPTFNEYAGTQVEISPLWDEEPKGLVRWAAYLLSREIVTSNRSPNWWLFTYALSFLASLTPRSKVTSRRQKKRHSLSCTFQVTSLLMLLLPEEYWCLFVLCIKTFGAFAVLLLRV